MFGFFGKFKDNLQKPYIKYTDNNPSTSSVSEAYCKLISCDRDYTRRFGKELSRMISDMSEKQIIRLSETFRKCTTSYCWWSYDWDNFDAGIIKQYTECEEDYINILSIGTFHPNGYYRQQCLEKLAPYENVCKYIILRLNDWIKNVRESAEKILAYKIKKCSVTEIFSLIPYIYKIKYSGRYDHEKFRYTVDCVCSIIENHADEISIPEIVKYDFETRKYIYKILCERKILSAEKFEKILDYEKHIFCQSYLITHFIQLYKPDIQKTDEFLNHKNSIVRYHAMQYKYNFLNDIWEGIENMLLDSKKSIREFTVYLLRKHTNCDIAGFYRKNLDSENPLNAIRGLGETGIKSDTALIKPFLESENSRIVSASITALNYLSHSENEDIFWKYLHDNRPNVSKSAYMAIKQCLIRYGCETIYSEIINTENKIFHQYLINMLCHNEDSWERIPYLLKLFNTDCKSSSQNTIYNAICHRNIYKTISPQLEKKIRSAISEKRNQIPKSNLISDKNITEKILWGIEQDLKYMCRW